MEEFTYELERSFALAGAALAVVLLICLAVGVFVIACWWRLFTKAGKPGWAAIVPIYNVIVMLEIVGRPLWWILLFLLPCVNIIVGIMLMVDLAKAFGKDTGFAIGLIFLGIIFLPILAFGSSRYLGPVASDAFRYGGGGYPPGPYGGGYPPGSYGQPGPYGGYPQQGPYGGQPGPYGAQAPYPPQPPYPPQAQPPYGQPPQGYYGGQPAPGGPPQQPPQGYYGGQPPQGNQPQPPQGYYGGRPAPGGPSQQPPQGYYGGQPPPPGGKPPDRGNR